MAFPSSDYLDMISDRSDNYTSLAANTTVVHYYDDDNDDVWYPLPTLHPTFSTAVKENTSNLYATPLLVIALLVMVAAVVSLRRRSNPQRESKFDKIMLDEEIEECRKKSCSSPPSAERKMQAVIGLNGESILLKEAREDRDSYLYSNHHQRNNQSKWAK